MPLAPDAAGFAARAHRHQTRKDGVTPYFSHAARVALSLAAEFGVADDGVIAAALLHDTIEDCGVDHDELREQFGDEIADWVSCLSKDARLPEAERERVYLAAVVAGPWQVHAVKLADALDNLRDSRKQSPESRAKTRSKAVAALEALAPVAGERLAKGVELLRAALAETA